MTAHVLSLSEEPHLDFHAVRHVLARLEKTSNRAASTGLTIRSALRAWRVADVRRAISGLPSPGDYTLAVEPLRYRRKPYLSGLCEFDVGRIIVRVPEPFRAFDELVFVSARRLPGERMRFAWRSEKVRFRSRRDVVRFVYLHEWLHWYLREIEGRPAMAETACDRFALRNFRRRRVTVEDAIEALRGWRTRPQLESLRLAA